MLHYHHHCYNFPLDFIKNLYVYSLLFIPHTFQYTIVCAGVGEGRQRYPGAVSQWPQRRAGQLSLWLSLFLLPVTFCPLVQSMPLPSSLVSSSVELDPTPASQKEVAGWGEGLMFWVIGSGMKDCEDQSQVHLTSLKISSRLNFLYLRFRDVFPQKKILLYIVRTKDIERKC